MKALMFIGMPTIQGESGDKAQLAIRPLILAVVKVLEVMAFEVAMLFGVIEKIPTEQETLTLSEQVCVLIYIGDDFGSIWLQRRYYSVIFFYFFFTFSRFL